MIFEWRNFGGNVLVFRAIFSLSQFLFVYTMARCYLGKVRSRKISYIIIDNSYMNGEGSLDRCLLFAISLYLCAIQPIVIEG